jgi:fatty acid desaturase
VRDGGAQPHAAVLIRRVTRHGTNSLQTLLLAAERTGVTHVRDERLRDVEWRDLLPLSRGEVVYESLIAAPWLAGSLTAWHFAETSHRGFAAVALATAFFFFLTGLRQVHNAYHHALGLGRRSTDLTMFALSVGMMSAMHAIQATHLNHHRHCLADADVEGRAATQSWWKAVLGGPAFTVHLHRSGWALAAPRARRWIVAETVAIATTIVAAMLLDWLPLLAHVFTMVAGQCFTAFFAVWTVHHDCPPAGRVARTQRGWLKNLVSYDMFHHVEHHLFPAVPTCHLPELSQRLDRAAPDYKDLMVY